MSIRNLRRLIADESGSTLVEYGLVLALFSAGLTAVLITVGTTASSTFSSASGSMQSFQAAPPP